MRTFDPAPLMQRSAFRKSRVSKSAYVDSMSASPCWQELTSRLRKFLETPRILGIPIPRLKLVFPRSQKARLGHPNFVVELRFAGDMGHLAVGLHLNAGNLLFDVVYCT
jgi:hypothetical protein